jgi:mannose-1-phosphate guanylyltransferase
MKAILLAAGIGSRLRPITLKIPKCLVPINGVPLLKYWLDFLSGAGIDKVLINTHYLADQVESFLLDGGWRDFVSISHEDVLLGTGGTILKNLDFFGSDDDLMVIHADNLSKFDINKFILQHAQRGSSFELTMMTFKTDSPTSCGILEFDGNGQVIAFHEKVKNPPGNIANAAIYIFSKKAIEDLKGLNMQNVDISTEFIPSYLPKISCYLNDAYHRDIGTIESLRVAESEFKFI